MNFNILMCVKKFWNCKDFRTKKTRAQIVGLITSISCSIARYNDENNPKCHFNDTGFTPTSAFKPYCPL